MQKPLVKALGLIYLCTVKSNLREGQVLVLAGYFSGVQQDDAWVITGGHSVPEPTQELKSIAQEADMRV